MELPEKIRTFISIYPPDAVVVQLSEVQKQLQTEIAPAVVNWTKLEQIHLTLQFLGHIKHDLLAEFLAAIERVANETRCFEIRAETIGCFPDGQRPRIIWSGLSGEIDSLQVMKQKLDVALSQLGYLPEERKFHPHLTIGRAVHLKSSDAQKLAKGILKFASKQFGEWQVQKVNLMQSILSSRGAEHRVFKSFPLKIF